jgi:3-oxoacyl-[acyl-carrier protein] reductase
MTRPQLRLENRAAIVTGGGQGIGQAVARAFDREGAFVAVLDLNLDAAKLTVTGFLRGLAVHCDVSDSGSVDTAFAQVAREFSGLDILAHVAAVKSSTSEFARLRERSRRQAEELSAEGRIRTALESTVNLSDEEWQRQIAVDLTGTFYCTRAALRIMGPRGSGCIINTSSNTALTGWAGIAGYTAAKAGVIGFSKSVAQEVARQGIRVNVIAPGGVDTPMPSREVEDLKRSGAARGPLGRLAAPEELADAYVYLASDESSYVIGETLNVNGGIHTL